MEKKTGPERETPEGRGESPTGKEKEKAETMKLTHLKLWGLLILTGVTALISVSYSVYLLILSRKYFKAAKQDFSKQNFKANGKEDTKEAEETEGEGQEQPESLGELRGPAESLGEKEETN